MAESPTEITDQLRQWARGMYTTEAATELLIRARNGTFASIDRPWIKPGDHGYWIDFPAITEHLDALSGGEQRLLRIAASIGSDEATPVRLGDVAERARPADAAARPRRRRPCRRQPSTLEPRDRSRRPRDNHQAAVVVHVGRRGSSAGSFGLAIAGDHPRAMMPRSALHDPVRPGDLTVPIIF